MNAADGIRENALAEFELTSFEEVRATPTTSLLRLTGRWKGAARPPDAPALVIDTAGRRDRLLPLAGPPHEGAERLWRAGYAIPPDALATHGVTFALDTGSGDPIELPLPARVRDPGLGARSSTGTARRHSTDAPIRLSDADNREREKLERLTRELERAQREVERLRHLEERLVKSEAARTAAETQVETLRAQLHEARAHAADIAGRRRT